MDVIRLKEITVFPRLGVGELEKEWVQKVTLDVELHLDLGAAGRSDDLRRTVDYQRVYELVRKVSEEREYHLIEALAERIGIAVREQFPVRRVVVRVRKLSLPFDAHLSCVEIEMSVPPEAPDGEPRAGGRG
jgi:dihydroneopterin aldolase